MFLRGKLCQKRIFSICACSALLLSLLLSVFSYSSASAVAVHNLVAITNWWQSGSPNNSYVQYQLSNQTLPAQILDSQSDMISNKLLQFAASTGQTLSGKYFYGKVKFGISVSTDTIPGSSLMGGFNCDAITNAYIKPEQGVITSLNNHIDKCEIQTIYADPQTTGYQLNLVISASGVLQQTTSVSSYVVSVGSYENNPFMRVYNSNGTVAYILNTMDVDFQLSADETVSGMGEINQSLSSIDNSINSAADSEQERWEIERQEQAEKEAELNDDADDLGLSASVTGNPFTTLFYSYPFATGNICYTTTKIHELFNSSSWTICSPYPSTWRSIFTVVTTLICLGLIYRLYYKKLRGGVDG